MGSRSRVLPGGTGYGYLPLDLSLNLVLSTLMKDLGWDKDCVLLWELTLLGVLEADLALLAKYVGLCSKPMVCIDLISVEE